MGDAAGDVLPVHTTVYSYGRVELLSQAVTLFGKPPAPHFHTCSIPLLLDFINIIALFGWDCIGRAQRKVDDVGSVKRGVLTCDETMVNGNGLRNEIATPLSGARNDKLGRRFYSNCHLRYRPR